MSHLHSHPPEPERTYSLPKCSSFPDPLPRPHAPILHRPQDPCPSYVFPKSFPLSLMPQFQLLPPDPSPLLQDPTVKLHPIREPPQFPSLLSLCFVVRSSFPVSRLSSERTYSSTGQTSNRDPERPQCKLTCEEWLWAPSLISRKLPLWWPFPVPLTWLAGNGLNGQSQLGVRSDRQRLVT